MATERVHPVKCPNEECGRTNPHDNRYCVGCSEPLPRYCTSCGFLSPPETDLCRSCGRPVDGDDGELDSPTQSVQRGWETDDPPADEGSGTEGGTVVDVSETPAILERISGRRTEAHGLEDELLIGRDVDGDQTLAISHDKALSAEHARVYRDGGSYRIEDRRSSNGTFVEIREPTRLRHGDLIRVGGHVFRFELPGSTGDAETPGASPDAASGGRENTP